jgi:hypothetical protein
VPREKKSAARCDSLVVILCLFLDIVLLLFRRRSVLRFAPLRQASSARQRPIPRLVAMCSVSPPPAATVLDASNSSDDSEVEIQKGEPRIRPLQFRQTPVGALDLFGAIVGPECRKAEGEKISMEDEQGPPQPPLRAEIAVEEVCLENVEEAMAAVEASPAPAAPEEAAAVSPMDQNSGEVSEDRSSKRRRLARNAPLAKGFHEALRARTGSFSFVPDARVVDAALREAVEKLRRASLESRLCTVEDDLCRLRDMPPEALSRLPVGHVVRCQMLTKTLEASAHEQTVSGRKIKKRSYENASFRDRLDDMEAAVKKAKTRLAELVGRKDLQFGWFDSHRNLAHMTLADVDAFPAFFEEVLREFESDPGLQLPGKSVNEGFSEVLRLADLYKDLDAVFTTAFGKDFDFVRVDHSQYRALLKEQWLRRLKKS